MNASPRVLGSISPAATPEEVAAIVAAVTAAAQARQPGALAGPEPAPANRWVLAARMSARRVGLARGEWRLSGRLPRRARA